MNMNVNENCIASILLEPDNLRVFQFHDGRTIITSISIEKLKTTYADKYKELGKPKLLNTVGRKHTDKFYDFIAMIIKAHEYLMSLPIRGDADMVVGDGSIVIGGTEIIASSIPTTSNVCITIDPNMGRKFRELHTGLMSNSKNANFFHNLIKHTNSLDYDLYDNDLEKILILNIVSPHPYLYMLNIFDLIEYILNSTVREKIAPAIGTKFQ
jgi:hypothetical protein